VLLPVFGFRKVRSGFTRDNTWQHCCVTWNRFSSPKGGKVVFYHSGTKVHDVDDLSKTRSLVNGGTLVIGQYQDAIGGNFNAHRLMVGHMTGLNIWSRAFSANEVDALSKSCTSQEGDVVSWANVVSSPVQGGIQALSPSTCST
jgi:hypothetical protein